MLYINVIDPSCLTDLSPQERNLSTSQPLDQGIIRFLKVKYLTKIVQKDQSIWKSSSFSTYISLWSNELTNACME